MDKAYSVEAVANAFIFLADKVGKRLTHLQLQKFVFLAQGFALASLGRPAYFNETEAWKNGPVVPDLYHSLKYYGNGKVNDFIPAADAVDDGSPDANVIELVYRVLGEKSGRELSGFTHGKGSPWAITRERGKYVIDKELIRERFKFWTYSKKAAREASAEQVNVSR